MTSVGICGKLIVEKKRLFENSIDKGKPFERVGHKTLEPKDPKGSMAVSCQKDKLI